MPGSQNFSCELHACFVDSILERKTRAANPNIRQMFALRQVSYERFGGPGGARRFDVGTACCVQILRFL
jgi:hypothetical protein